MVIGIIDLAFIEWNKFFKQMYIGKITKYTYNMYNKFILNLILIRKNILIILIMIARKFDQSRARNQYFDLISYFLAKTTIWLAFEHVSTPLPYSTIQKH